MGTNELEKMIEDSGLRICAVCSTPFKPYHARQKTCGDPDCKRIYHNKWCLERNKRMLKEHPNEFRKYRRDVMRRYRAKKRAVVERDKQLEKVSEHWKKQEEFEKKISEYGYRYGEVSAQKVLERVPKIDVTLGGETNGKEDFHD